MLKCDCGLVFKKPQYPVYCRCGAIYGKSGIINLVPIEPQPPIDNIVAVTSLSPNSEFQAHALKSWKAFGLKIWAVNSPTEIANLFHRYEVDRWIESSHTDGVRQYINTLMDLTSESNILLLNADIAIYGPQSRILDILSSRKVGVGVRYNYYGDYTEGRREGWGIDAFLLQKEHVADMPRLPLVMGKPFWDYWLPHHFDQYNVPMEWITEPYFFHHVHPLNWDTHDLDICRGIVEGHYGKIDDWNHIRERWPPYL